MARFVLTDPLGGDKTNRWRQWYERMIPIADRLFDEHLEELRKGG